MDVGLGIAGFICVAMAFGHETIGQLWILPGFNDEQAPKTPFGPRSMSVAMIRVTWHVVTIFAFTLGGLLITLAWGPDVAIQTLLLRWFAAMWLVAAAMAISIVLRGGTRSLRGLARLPVPVLWVVVALLLWNASI